MIENERNESGMARGGHQAVASKEASTESLGPGRAVQRHGVRYTLLRKCDMNLFVIIRHQ